MKMTVQELIDKLQRLGEKEKQLPINMCYENYYGNIEFMSCDIMEVDEIGVTLTGECE